MPDPTYKIMWYICYPESCHEEFGKEDWASSKEELTDKIYRVGEFILSQRSK